MISIITSAITYLVVVKKIEAIKILADSKIEQIREESDRELKKIQKETDEQIILKTVESDLSSNRNKNEQINDLTFKYLKNHLNKNPQELGKIVEELKNFCKKV